jgi:Flp pilus assembly protein TadD
MVSAPPDTKTAAADRTVIEIAAALQAGEYERAAQLAGSVLALGMHHPIVYNARALAFQQKGQFREALTEFSRARGLAPNDPNLLIAIGVCFINAGTPTEALQAFDAAIALDANNAQAHYRKGWTLEMLGERGKARTEYESAIAINPLHPEALGSLAALLATAGDITNAQTLAERALAVDPNQPTAVAALGTIDLAEKNFPSAEARFRMVLEDPQLTLRARAIIHGLLGDALDGQGRAADAFDAYRFGNNEIRKLYAHSYTGRARPRDFADRISAYLREAPLQPAMPEKVADNAQARPLSHVFVIGFPQSSEPRVVPALAANAQIAVLDDRDLLAEVAEIYLTSDAGLQRLASLTGSELEARREAYWQQVRESGVNVENKALLDLQPMNALKLPLIAKLFPDAKLVFQMRDPRDVVFDCYRGHFGMNSVNFEFLTLETAAELYEAVMRLVDIARERLPLAEHQIRFEDTTSDFGKRFAALCDFIGIDPTPAADIRIAPQSESPLHWRQYREQLRFVLPQLRPWAEKFGYESD